MGPPRLSGLKFTLVAGLALLTTDALFAQSAGQSDVDSLKTQMNQMQRQYEQRIEAMEAKMKSLESNANSGSILNARVLTDANGTEAPGKAPVPMLDESFLKSLTRNFTFNMYVRAGFMFNGNGGAGTFNFEVPDNPGGRFRLGNENDFYMESTFSQAHILGDSPDVMDVSFRMTPNFFTHGVFHESFLTTNNSGSPSDFNIGMREAFSEFKNVFKSAPDITFWGGQRFYDRYNIDPNDWFWLDTSGFGVGVYNIHLGPGNLYLAWIGANHDNLNLVNTPNQTFQNNGIGNQFEQTFDIRYKDIDIGFGKLAFILIGNYINGGQVSGPSSNVTFTDVLGNKDTVIVNQEDALGLGGGVIWEYDFGNKSHFQLWSLWGYGVTNFSAENLGQSVNAFEQNVNNFVIGRSATNVRRVGASNTFVGAANPYNKSTDFRSGFEFVWNVNPCFAFDLWGYWDHSNQGFQTIGTNAGTAVNPSTTGPFTTANATRNIYGVGLRPVVWITDNIAIQGQAGFNYVDNVRGYSGSNAFGNSGEFAIFTIAPTLKPKGGYGTRPEIRLFATYSIWSSSLKGTTTPTGEGGNTSGANPPYNGNTNQGWLIGTQVEVGF
jgi:maltoporin